MAELSQRQQDRISKSSSDRLRSQLVRSGMEEEEVSQMDRGELKAVAAQVEIEKQEGVNARLKPLPTTGSSCSGYLRRLYLNPRSMRYSK